MPGWREARGATHGAGEPPDLVLSPSAPKREGSWWRGPQSAPTRWPREAFHSASLQSLSWQAAGSLSTPPCAGLARSAAGPGQRQGRGAAGPAAASGPWPLTAICPDVPRLYRQAYHSTVKYIPRIFHFCSIFFLFPILSLVVIALLLASSVISLLSLLEVLFKNHQTKKSPIIT